MPSILPLEQYLFDSVRAEQWAKLYGDSTMLRKFLKKGSYKPKKDSLPEKRVVYFKKDEMGLPEERFYLKQKRSRA